MRVQERKIGVYPSKSKGHTDTLLWTRSLVLRSSAGNRGIQHWVADGILGGLLVFLEKCISPSGLQ
jgi:hypothetical protein